MWVRCRGKRSKEKSQQKVSGTISSNESGLFIKHGIVILLKLVAFFY